MHNLQIGWITTDNATNNAGQGNALLTPNLLLMSGLLNQLGQAYMDKLTGHNAGRLTPGDAVRNPVVIGADSCGY